MEASEPTFIEATRRMPLMELPLRTAVFPLREGRVLLSPASTLTEDQLRGAGEVTDIVMNTLLHADGLERAVAAHPRARLWGPPGAREKHPQLTWGGVLGEDPWPYEEELAHLPLGGLPKVGESLFLHVPARALHVADLAFNLVDARGLGAWMILSMFGTYRRFGVSRLFLSFVKDRPAFLASLQRVFERDFTALVPGHGAVVEADAKERLREALQGRGYAP